MKITNRILLLYQYGLHFLAYKETAIVESADFGAEFVAMKQAMEVSRGLRYQDDGGTYRGAQSHVWRQHVNHSQHSMA